MHMADPTSEEAMGQRRDELQTRLDQLDEERSQISRQLTAINLYLNALKGELPTLEPVAAAKPERKAHRASTGSRAPRGERRGQIMEILRREQDGYTFDKILDLMEVTTDREKKQIYATLHNMKRKGDITQHSNKHFVAPQAEEKGNRQDATR